MTAKKKDSKQKVLHPVQGKIRIVYKSDGKILDTLETYSNINTNQDEIKEIVIEDHFSNHIAYKKVQQEVSSDFKSKQAINKFKDKFNFDMNDVNI